MFALALCLTGTALADGGTGGSQGACGGLQGGGGSGIAGANGGNGGACTGAAGGGGGGGAGGGSGGAGAQASNNNGAGGTAGTAGAGGLAGVNGGAGGDGGVGGDAAISNTPGGSGGGGGGGAHGTTAASITNGGSLAGGAGGKGGNGGAGNGLPEGGAGGGGGGGGYGAIVTGNAASSNSGTIAGGAGGNGGNAGSGGGGGTPRVGSGGDGGIGILFSASGTTFTNTGTVRGGAGGALGSGDSTIQSNGSGGASISGAGLTIINSSNIIGGLGGDGSTRANAISFTGGTNRLDLQSGFAITGTVAAFSSADTLALGGAGNFTFDVSQIGASAQYRGFGVFEKTGAATVTLSNTTSAVTPWTVSGGILNISASGALGDASGTLTMNGGTLQAGGSFTLSNAIAINTAGGSIDTGGANTLALGGAIANGTGAGALTVTNSGGGTGVVMLGSASNSWSGATTIGDGTVAVVLEAGGGKLSANSAVTVSANAFLNTGGSDQTIASLAGAGTLQAAGGITQTLSSGGNNASTTFSGLINNGGGTLALSKTGTGTLTFSGNNSYSGGTTLSAGGIAVGNSGALGTGALAMAQGTNLSFTASGLTLANAITANGDPTFFVDTGQSETISGVISDGTPAGVVEKTGAGILILTGANTYSGGTTISAGTLQIGAGGTVGAIIGDVTDNGALVFNRSDSPFFSGAITGTGSVAITGGGFVTLASLSSNYSGGTFVSGNSTVAVSGDAGLGAVTGTVNLGDATTLGILRGLNSSIVLDPARNIVIGAGGGKINSNGTFTVSGSLSGGGEFISGTNTVILLGTDSHTGGTAVLGTLQIGNGGNSGNLNGDVDVVATGAPFPPGKLVFDRSDSYAYGGIISGGGDVAQSGGGTLILSATNTYTGATTVTAGILSVTGSIAASSGVTVQNNATLAGTGTVAATTVQSGGALTPGVNGIGTLTVNGNLALQSGSATQMEVSQTDNDKVLVTGTASIDGQLFVNFAGGAGYASKLYTLITSTGALSGTFVGFNTLGSPAGLVTALSYDAHDVFLTLSNSTLIWGATPGSSDWNTGANWQSGFVPGVADTAIFNATSQTSVTVAQATNAKSIQFNSGAPAYTLAITGSVGGPASLTLATGGIVDNSSNAPTITVSGADATNTGTLSFFGSGTAADAKITAGTFGTVSFNALTDAGAAAQLTAQAGGTIDFSASTGLLGDNNVSAGSIAGAGSLKLGANTLTVGALNTSTEFSGVIDGSGGLIKTGTGTLTLSGNNSYGGATGVQGGTLAIASSSVLPTVTNVTISTGAKLNLGDGSSYTINTLSDGTGGSGGLASLVIGTNDPNVSLTVDGGSGTSTFSGQITGPGSFGFTGGGTQVLAGAGSSIGGGLSLGGFGSAGTTGGVVITGSLNSQGTTIVLDGALTVSNGGSLTSGATAIVSGTTGAVPSVTVTGAGSVWNVAGGISLGGVFGTAPATVTVADGGTLNVTTNNLIDIAAGGVLNIGSGAGAGLVNAPGIENDGQIVADFDTTTDATLAAGISGGGTLTKSGAGKLILSSQNGYTGDTDLDSGTIEITNGSGLGGSTLKMAAGTTLLMQSNFGSFSNNVTLTGDPAFNVAANTEAKADGVISDGASPGTLEKTGGGRLILAGTNSYSGGTVITAGTLQAVNTGAIGTGTITLNGGAFQPGAPDLNIASAFAVNSTGGTIDTNGFTLTLSGAIVDGNGSGTLTKGSGGTLILTAHDNYSGGTTIAAGTLQIGDASITGAITGSITNNAVLEFVNADNSGITTIANNGGNVNFRNGSSGASMVLTSIGGAVDFLDAADAGNITIQSSALGQVTFSGTSTADNAQITSVGAGINFANTSTAGNATITNGDVTSGGQVVFSNTSTAGTATITNGNAGSVVLFLNHSTGGDATLINGAGGIVDFSATKGANNDRKVTVGSLAGGGVFYLGRDELTLTGFGAAPLTGVISDCGSGTSCTTPGTGGALVVNGSVTLAGLNTYTGGTTVGSGGDLTIGTAGSIGAILGALTDAGTVEFVNANLSGMTTITASGALNFRGSTSTGNVVVTLNGGAYNFYDTSTAGNANISVNGGVSTFHDTSTAGNAILTFTNAIPQWVDNSSAGNATIIVNSGIPQWLDNSTAGHANITVNSGIPQWLDNSTAGNANITVNAGIPQWLNNSTAGNAIIIINGGITQFLGDSTGGNAAFTNNSILDFSGSTGPNGDNKLSAGSIAGSGSLSIGANQFSVGGDNLSTIYSGGIDGAGGSLVKTGSGTLTLSGGASYTGGTTISAGTLQIGDGGAGNGGSVTGNITDNAALVFDHAGAFSYGGVISGSGSLSDGGAGVATLTATQTYTGATTVSAGTLRVTGSIAASSGVTVRNGGTLGGTGTVAATAIHSGGTLAPGNGIGTLNVAGNLSFASGSTYNVDLSTTASDLTLVSGTAGLAGTLSASFANGAYAPGQVYTLLTSTGLLSGRFDNPLVANAPTNFLGLVSYDAHDVFVTLVPKDYIWSPAPISTDWNTGANWTFGFVPGAGDIAQFDATNAATVVDSQVAAAKLLQFNAGAPAYSLAVTGTASGAASLTVSQGITDASANAPTITVSGVSAANIGTLAFTGTGNAADAAVTAGSFGTVSFAGTTDAGAAAKLTAGTGATIDFSATTGANGDNKVSAGSIAGAGSFVLGANSLTVGSLNTSTEVSGSITGSGGLTKIGSGTLQLSGVNSYTGPTIINGGVLSVNGSITSNVTVAGGTLKGTGRVGGVTLTSGATLAPGNSIGTLNMAAVTFVPGSSYQAEVNAAGQSDLINVSGTATLAGTFQAVEAAGTYSPVTTYRILNAGSITGSFAPVVSSAANLTPALIYGTGSVDLKLTRNDLVFGASGNTFNQIAAGGAVSAGSISTGLYNTLAAVANTAAAVPAALDSLSGEIYASLRSAMLEDSHIVRDTLMDQLAVSASGTALWAQGFSSSGTLDSDGNAARAARNTSGAAGGVDTALGNLRLGLGGTLSGNKLSVAARGSSATGSSDTLFGYASWKSGPLAVSLGGDYGWGDMHIVRAVSALSETESSSRHGTTGEVFAQSSYDIDLAPMLLSPYVALDHVSAATDAFSETGGAGALSGGGATLERTYVLMGARAGFGSFNLDGMPLTPRAGLGWSHAFGGTMPGEVLAFRSTGQSFTVLGTPAAGDAALVSLGLDLNILPNLPVSLGYDGSFSNRGQTNTVHAGVSWTF